MIESLASSGLWAGRRRWAGSSRGRVLLADLQGTNVGDDGPAILHRDLSRVRRHRSPTIRNRVEEMSYRCLSEAVVIERRCPAETTAHDHAVAVSGHTVARGAEDVVTPATALYDLLSDRKRKSIDVVRESVGLRACCSCCLLLCGCCGCAWCSGFLTSEQLSIRTQVTTRNRSLDRLPASQSIAEERRATQRLDLRLVLHVPTTAGSSKDHEQENQ